MKMIILFLYGVMLVSQWFPSPRNWANQNVRRRGEGAMGDRGRELLLLERGRARAPQAPVGRCSTPEEDAQREKCEHLRTFQKRDSSQNLDIGVSSIWYV
jgi:hypothetical protein